MQSKLINNREKAQQILAFDGLQWGACRCTDIDLSLDWQGKTFVFVEIKTEGSPLTAGQKYHLQGLVKAIKAGGKEAYAIVATHNTHVSEDIHAAQCDTKMIFSGNNWELCGTGEKLCDTLNFLYEQHLTEQAA